MYTAEISYDGNSWRRLMLEQPDSTFVTFSVTEQKAFQIRVTPQGGIPTMQTFAPPKSGATQTQTFARAAGGKKTSTST